MNIVYKCFCAHVFYLFLHTCLGTESLWSCDSCAFTFLKNCQAVLQQLRILCSSRSIPPRSRCPASLPALDIICLLTVTILVGVM